MGRSIVLNCILKWVYFMSCKLCHVIFFFNLFFFFWQD
jgi:hypothetical protein